jgi:hypothetical protein
MSTVIQAPSRNFAPTITSSAAAVVNAPTALIRRDGLLTVRPSRYQCTTIPACDIVNAPKAPTAKSGMRRSVIPLKTKSKIAEFAIEYFYRGLVSCRSRESWMKFLKPGMDNSDVHIRVEPAWDQNRCPPDFTFPYAVWPQTQNDRSAFTAGGTPARSANPWA